MFGVVGGCVCFLFFVVFIVVFGITINKQREFFMILCVFIGCFGIACGSAVARGLDA